MAEEVLGIKVQVDTNAGEAVGSLRSQLKAAVVEAQTMSEQFGATSKQAIEASKRAAELRDKIEDINDSIQAFKGEGAFLAAGKALQSVASGFSAVQGAMGLFGNESKEIEKQLLKVQSAMALAQGLAGLEDAGRAFNQLSVIIKTKVIEAFTTLRGALIATGVGAFAIAIGTIAANWKAFSSAITEAFPAFQKVIDFFTNFKQIAVGSIKATVEGFKVIGDVVSKFFSGDFSGAMDSAKKFGTKVAEAYNTGYDEEDKKLKLENSLAQRKLELDLEEAKGKEILKKRLQFQKDELSLLKKGSDEYNQKLIEIEQTKAKIRDGELKKLEEQKREQRLYESRELETWALYLSETQKKVDDSILSIMKQKNVEKIDVQKSLNISEKQLREENYNTAMQFADLLGGLADASAELMGRNTEEGKALSIVTTLISTWLTAQKAFESQFNPVSDASSPIRGAIAAAAAVVQGLARVKAIQSIQVPKGGGGGGYATPSIGSVGGGYSFNSPMNPTANVTTTQLNQNSINQLKNQPVKAYVVESDISDSQQRQRRLIEASTFE